jgi:hypothetical protein
MAKTHAKGSIQVGGQRFTTNARPDAFDLRDLEYRPSLRALPPELGAVPNGLAFRVLTQKGESCTGHAMAAMVDTVLGLQAIELRLPEPMPVSPYMLYALARRYDEFPGQADVGSSLRGALKGWLRQGVATEAEWLELTKTAGVGPLDAMIDLDKPSFVASCRQRPLGAYYRVNPFRLDDMQSAINELRAVAVSAAIHTGWGNPVWIEAPDGAKFAVIKRDRPAEPAGGHAFAMVGYTELGFIVQNSWGPGWGDHGFAILTYDDWLASAYDAWVARPGVPNTPSAMPSSTSRVTTNGSVVMNGGPNLTLLRNYVVNTGNDGLLSTTGRFVSNPAQLDAIFANMAAKHAQWTAADGTARRDVLLYAHGGLINEDHGLGIAESQLGWWLNSHVYPINFVWESGAIETILSALADVTRIRLPFGGLRFDAEEHFDRLVEGLAHQLFSGLWGQMKGNAEGASAQDSSAAIRGGTEIARRLLVYRDQFKAANVKIHLAGHSAGGIFLAALAKRLLGTGLDIESMALMASAGRNDVFATKVLPSIGPGGDTTQPRIKRFTTFDLVEQMEQDDTCPGGNLPPLYHKSLLYLVARGLEGGAEPKTGIAPLVGLQRGLEAKLTGSTGTLGAAISAAGGAIVMAPGGTQPGLRSDARGHGDFDNDPATLTSILLRMLDRTAEPAGPYVPNQPLKEPSGTLPAGVALIRAAAQPTPQVRPMGAGVPLAAAAEQPALAERQVASPAPLEAAIGSATDSPTFDMIFASGYRAVQRGD